MEIIPWITLLLIILIILIIILSLCRENFESGCETAILVVSIGKNRPFFKYFKPYFKFYAKKTNSDLIIKKWDNLESIPKVYLDQIKFYQPTSKDADKFRRRMMKMVFLKELTYKYKRIILFDDSCFIIPSTPNLFNLVPMEKLGAVTDYGLLGKLNGHNSINTGIMVISPPQFFFFRNFEFWYKNTKKAIAGGKFNWVGVDQSFVNYGISKNLLQVELLPHKYNVVTSLITDDMVNTGQGLDGSESPVQIYHLTGTWENLKLMRAKRLTDLNPLF